MQIEIVTGLVGGIPLKSVEKQFSWIFIQTVWVLSGGGPTFIESWVTFEIKVILWTMEFTKSVIVLFYYCFWGICALLATYWSFWSFFVKGAIFYKGTTMIASHFGPELSMYLLDHDKSPLPLKGKCSVRCWLHIVRWLNWLLFSMESSGVYKQAVPVLLPLAQIGLTGDRARAQNCHSRVVHIKCP